ncbi:hypothetical protein PGTUg99_010505 [Puccinia graminis f. sp. tritici]|uniref:Uncharacterized protein n=1 Tax=Puccinia graminis f. sp. tritici TaxID=56615 RepID=A0A5B0RV38_PUCGR|nr:hypothetical protein PGTUg99_010505 [Puccinia graminis f. sp. tritici]
MDLPDFSDQLEKSETSEQFVDWLNEAFGFEPKTTDNPPSANPSTPTKGLAVTTVSPPSNQVNHQSRRLEESNSARRKDHVGSEQIKVSIEYRFYVLDTRPKPTPNTRVSNKRKAPPIEPEDKYIKITSDLGKVHIYWESSNTCLSDFKSAVIDTIAEKEGKRLGGHVRSQEEEGDILWYAIIPHGHMFVEKNKTTLEDDDIFEEFLAQAKGTRDGRKNTVNLLQRDPKVVAQKKQALENLEKQDGGNEERTELNDHEPTAGASNSQEIMNNIWMLRATHMPCERLTGSSELPVMICPSDSNRFIALTTDRLGLWARSMINNKEVTLHKPPISPPFKFQTKEEFLGISGRKREDAPDHLNHAVSDSAQPPGSRGTNQQFRSQSTEINPFPTTNHNHLATTTNFYPSQTSHFAMGPFFHPQMGWATQPWVWGPQQNIYQSHPVTPTAMAPNTLQTQTESVSSPACSEISVDINDYFHFCHVDPECEAVNKVLSEYGITHYSEFENFEAGELEALGVKKSNARSLVSRVQKFKQGLKKRHQQKKY